MKQLRQLWGQWKPEKAVAPTSTPTSLTSESPSPAAPDSHVGATEHQIALQLNRGARVETEISEVTPTEIRSKFIIQGVGITGVGITPREKYDAVGPEPAIGDVVTQEVESWEFENGQCVAALRLVSPKPKEVPEGSPLKALEDDRIQSIEGG
ncbi:MAG: hypothetical protein BroJett018_40330 [Chloroflexota bacterium]|nr:MAG: hypothetical protein BroJett018_40330 [Chloroflexota bacterium]